MRMQSIGRRPPAGMRLFVSTGDESDESATTALCNMCFVEMNCDLLPSCVMAVSNHHRAHRRLQQKFPDPAQTKDCEIGKGVQAERLSQKKRQKDGDSRSLYYNCSSIRFWGLKKKQDAAVLFHGPHHFFKFAECRLGLFFFPFGDGYWDVTERKAQFLKSLQQIQLFKLDIKTGRNCSSVF